MKKIPKEGLYLLAFIFLLMVYDIFYTLLDLRTYLESMESPILAGGLSLLLFFGMMILPLWLLKKMINKNAGDSEDAGDKKKGSKLKGILIYVLIWFFISSLGLPSLELESLSSRILFLMLMAGGILGYYRIKTFRQSCEES